MNWLLPALGILGWLGNRDTANQQNQANQLAMTQAAKQGEIVDYLLNKRKKIYDPIEEETVIPRLKERATSTPFYAGDWLKQSRGLRQPMELSY